LETGAAAETNQLALLNASQTYQQSAINLIQAQANRYADTAALFQALGGGWWNRTDLAKLDSESPTTANSNSVAR
jgi:outer membrane protein TolC